MTSVPAVGDMMPAAAGTADGDAENGADSTHLLVRSKPLSYISLLFFLLFS